MRPFSRFRSNFPQLANREHCFIMMLCVCAQYIHACAQSLKAVCAPTRAQLRGNTALNPAFSSTPHYSFYLLISLHTLISAWHFPFFLRLPSRFLSNIICTLFGNDEGIHQLDSSNPILDLAPISNLDSEQVKEMFVYNQVHVKIPGAKQLAMQQQV